MSIVSDAQDAGLEAQRGVIGLDSIISRGASTVSRVIVPGLLKEHELGFMTRDFLVKRSDYSLGDPLPQDLIATEGETWEVLPFEGERAWSRFQGTPNWIRVHTKEVGWSRDTLTFDQPRRILTAGDQRPQSDASQPVKGLVRSIGGSESYQGDMQQIAFTDYRAIVPSTAATRAIKPQDKFKFTAEGRCRTLNIMAVRDPGTNGSVLYLECREQMN
ncbi:hypothetical protein [Planctomyces sp. SH-PL14]|uniref:hypothetical protein n=1 Tax=Planctomyces sp. SH-PL14 TaxID=1632864 RepID=UPI00078DAAEE|nr:hypothetical protein [Planctomyces sp. SH-PL14]AMV18256.1 hypothetical protein VT03_10230 [Planctomyces sp. SH-PL14]